MTSIAGCYRSNFKNRLIESIMSSKTKSYLAILYFVELFLLAGFALTYDEQPGLILGRYTAAYAGFLVLLILPAPFLPAFVRFMAKESIRLTRDGRKIKIAPGSKCAYLAILIFVSLVALESIIQIARAFGPQGKTKEYLIQFHPFLQVLPDEMVYDGVNRDHFRGPDIPKAKSQAYRIFCLGGSTTFNPFLKFEDSYPRQLERQLQEVRPVELLNAGMSWYTSQHSLINYLIRIQEYQPDMIIVMHGINDLIRSFSPPRAAIGAYRSDYSHFLGPQADMILDLDQQRQPTLADSLLLIRNSSSFFSRHFFRQLREERNEMEIVDVVSFSSLDAYQLRMRNLCEIALTHGVKVILVTQGFLYKDEMSAQEKAALRFARESANDGRRMASMRSLKRGMELFNEATRNLAREYKLPLVDIEKTLPKNLEYFVDDVHFTPKAARLIASAVKEKISTEGLLGRD